jgi:ABC-type Zn uptake system ZnuABC Zn-binding protein ZnuA
MKRIALIVSAALIALVPALPAVATVKVVTTLPSYGAIAREVGGTRVDVQSISRPDEDSHFVKPKPSLALKLKDADLFVTTGLDLELWGPTLVDKSGNRRIRDGEPGFLAVSHGIHMLDVPSSTSRSGGDIHIYGNPHIHTSPINAKIIAGNIAAALERIDPSGQATYRENLAGFRQRIDEALYGKELVGILGADTLDPLALKGELIPFLETNEFEGRPLLDRLGGWLAEGLPFRGRKIIAYHKNWIYFTALFGLEVAEFVELKPGIPPSARHVHDLVKTIENQGIRVLLSATYFDASKPNLIAQRTGCTVVRVGLEPGEDESYFDLVDRWIGGLADAFAKKG